MQMEILRCKTPDIVHKEIGTHLLAYNLLRTVMAAAAKENNIALRTISFRWVPAIDRLIGSVITSRFEPRAEKWYKK